MCQSWVREVSLAQGMPEHLASQTTAVLRTFGSYRLDIHSAGTDIDTLCIAPNFITRESFFTELLGKLRAHPKVTELKDVRNAFVPLITFRFDAIEIDLMYAPLPPSVVDHFNIFDDSILRSLDPETIRSLNGPRCTDMLLSLVPEVETFKVVMRCVKLWAKRASSCCQPTIRTHDVLSARCQFCPL